MVLKTIKNLSRLVLIEHSVFALPFTLASFLIALGQGALILTHSVPVLLFLAISCSVTARTAAMGFNRLMDIKFDSANPRTANRELVTGEVSKVSALGLVLFSSFGFLLCAFFIGKHCAVLAPFVLLFLFFYTFTKRFTSYSHLVLGVALGLAPGGAWWILRPQVEAIPLLLMAAVSLWVAGFDIMYACQDAEFDRLKKLFSIPAALGLERALVVARIFHFISFALLSAVGLTAKLGLGYLVGLLPVGLMFIYQHRLVRGGDLTRLNRAFFTVNGWVAFYYLSLVAVVTLRL